MAALRTRVRLLIRGSLFQRFDGIFGFAPLSVMSLVSRSTARSTGSPSAVAMGVRPAAFISSSFAPRSARNCITSTTSGCVRPFIPTATCMIEFCAPVVTTSTSESSSYAYLKVFRPGSAGGRHQHVGSILRPQLRVRTARDQGAHDLFVVPSRRHHQRRLLSARAAPEATTATTPTGRQHRSRRAYVGVSALLEQLLDERQIADLGGEMHGCVTRAISRVEISTGIEQHQRRLGVPIGHGDHQRCASGRKRVVGIGTCLEQGRHRLDVVLSGREDERRKAVLRRGLHVGANLDQRADDVFVPFGGRPHECGLPAPGIGGVHIGAVKHELPHRIHAAGTGGNHERGFAVPAGRIRFCAGVEQSLDEHGIAVGRCERQRRFAVLVDGIGSGAGIEQRLCHRALAEMDRPRQRSRAVRLCRVEVGLGTKQRAERLQIAALDRIEQPQIRCCCASNRRCEQPPAPARTLRTHDTPMNLVRTIKDPSTVPCCRRTRRT